MKKTKQNPREFISCTKPLGQVRDDHYLSHLEPLPDKSFLEVDRPLKCSHWVREMNSSCVFIISAVQKRLRERWPWSTGIQANSWDTQLGIKGTCSHEQQDYSSSPICWKKPSGSQKNLKIEWHHLVLLGFWATNTGPLGKGRTTVQVLRATCDIFHIYVI